MRWPRVGFDNGTYRPFFAAGWSVLDVDFALSGMVSGSSLSFNTSESLNGWKVGAGVDIPVGEYALVHVMAHYADYGEEAFVAVTDAGLDAGASQYGASVGIGLRF